MDSKLRFSKTADAYVKYRPDYPDALVRWITTTAALCSGDPVADIGCGTGISTRLFARKGFDAIGIDPNDDMLERARDEGIAKYQKGGSDATGLPDASAKLVMAAQAFHWFDIASTMREFQRIVTPDGWCVAFWNVRAKTPLLLEYEALLNTLRDYRAIRKPEDTIALIAGLEGLRAITEASFENAQVFDRESFRGRVASSSYVVHGVEDRDGFFQQIDAMFDRYANGGVVEFGYQSVAIMWRFGT